MTMEAREVIARELCAHISIHPDDAAFLGKKLEAALSREGYAVVLMKPSNLAIDAGCEAIEKGIALNIASDEIAGVCWGEMLAASHPNTPKAGEGG